MTLFENIVKEITGKSLITEDKVTDYIKKLINRNVSETFKPYLKTSVNDLPENFQQYFKNIEEHSFKVCSEKNFNLTQFFRLYFLNFFGLSHGKGPSDYIMGIARIAIEQLDMFNEDANHGKLSKLKQLVTFIANEPDKIPEKFDSDLNGLNYKKLEEIVYPYYKESIESDKKDMEDIEEKSDYTIVPINSFSEAHEYEQYFPDDYGLQRKWCITHEKSHFNSYTTRGERFYFCLKNGFENIEMKEGENCPLDEYGLSMISVLVDMDGQPVHVTTRWNHAFDGEDNPGLRTAKQVQEVVGVNFYETFKPFTEEELDKLRANGDYEEDEETRYENYCQERWEHQIPLWDGVVIMPEWNDDYEFNENCDYYVYDENHDDQTPVDWENVDTAPVYVNEEQKLAILRAKRGDTYSIVYEYTSDRDRVEMINRIENYVKLTIEGEGDLIVYVKDDKLSYVCGGDFGESNDKIDFGIEEDVKLFLNQQIKGSGLLNSYEVPIEVIHDDDYRHSLFVITMGGNDVRTVVKSDVPENQMMFVVDDQGVISGSLRKYNLGSESNYSEEYQEGRIIDIEKNLDGTHFLVRVETNDEYNCYNIIQKGSQKKLIPFDFFSYKFLNGKENIVIRKKLSNKHSFDNASFIFNYETNSFISNQHNDFAWFKSPEEENLFMAADTEDGKNIVFYLLNNNDLHVEFGPFTKFDTSTFLDGKIIIKGFNGEGYTYVFDLETFKPIKKFINYGIADSNKYNFKDIPYLCFQELNEEQTEFSVNLYYYPTLQVIETNVAKYTSKGKVIVVSKKDNTKSLINTDTKKVVLNGLQECDFVGSLSYGSYVYAIKNNFAYIVNTSNFGFYPTEYGIDLTGVEQKYVDYNSFCFTFTVKGIQVKVKYIPSRSEEGLVEVGVEGNYGYNLLKDCSPEIQNIVTRMLYPRYKVQVANNFNEMINRMKNLVW